MKNNVQYLDGPYKGKEHIGITIAKWYLGGLFLGIVLALILCLY